MATEKKINTFTLSELTLISGKEKIQKEILELKFRKSKHLLLIDELLLKGNINVDIFYLQLGRIEYTLKIKERELLSLSKNTLED